MKNAIPYVLAAAVVISLLTFSTILGQELSRDDFDTVRSAARANCAVVNETRSKASELGMVVKRFLLTAAVAREDTAEAVRKAGARRPEVQVNLIAARRYRKDAARISALPPIDCAKSFP